MADVYSLSIRADTTDVARARQALNGLSSGAIRAEKTTKQLSNANQQLARTSRFSANGLRNTSLQLSQVAQQGAATGNFLQALAIQLPDLALAFGPVGIALGAVAGGLASYVLGSQEAAEETETLTETIKNLDERLRNASDGTLLLSDELKSLAEISRDAARIELIVDAQKAKRTAITAANEVINTFQSIAGDNPLLPDTIYSDRIGEISDTLNIAREDAEELGEALPRSADRSKEAYQTLLGVVADLAEKYGANSPQVLKLARSLNVSSVAAIRALNAEEDLAAALERTDKVIGDSTGGTGGGSSYEDLIELKEEATKSAVALTESLQFQVDTYGESARSIALAKIEQMEKNGADATAIAQARELTNALYDQIEAERRQQEMQKAMMQSTKIEVGDDPILQRIEAQRRGQELLAEESAMWAQKIAANQETIQQQSVATVGASIGAMQSFFEAGSAEFIAFGLLQKGLMAGQAVMAANLAATLALTAQVPGDPTGPARAIAQAETIRTLGYINAGLILATGIGEAVSGARQMGGSVTGGRSYLVGESGPEVVTMGGSGVVTPSSVMDAGKNQGGDWVVNINNAPPGTRTESRTDDSGNRYTEVFIADMANGGPMSKTIQGTFGLRRQGR